MFVLLFLASLANVFYAAILLWRDIAYTPWGLLGSGALLNVLPIKIVFVILFVFVPILQAGLWFRSRRVLAWDDKAYLLKIITIVHFFLTAAFCFIRPDGVLFLLTDIIFWRGVKPLRGYNFLAALGAAAALYCAGVAWFFAMVFGPGIGIYFKLISAGAAVDDATRLMAWMSVGLLVFASALPAMLAALGLFVSVKNIRVFNPARRKLLLILSAIFLLFSVPAGLFYPHVWLYAPVCLVFIVLAWPKRAAKTV